MFSRHSAATRRFGGMASVGWSDHNPGSRFALHRSCIEFMPRSNVVITGTGVVSSIGIGGDAYFRALLSKQTGVRSLADRTDDGAQPSADQPQDGIWLGAPILEFDPKQYVRPRKAMKVMCREIQTAFAAAMLAIEDGALADMLPADPKGQLRPRHVGTVFGSEMFYGPPQEMVDVVRDCQRDDGTIDESKFAAAARKNVMPLWMLKYLPNMPACHISIAVNSHGPNNSLVLGDVSGLAAVIEAATCIDRGIVSLMIAGATGTRVSTTRINYRGNLPAPKPCEPIGLSCRPHDPTSVGVVGGEAAAAVVLESPEQASRRGAQPLAELAAFAQRFAAGETVVSGDMSARRGSVSAISTAVEAALGDAGIRGDEIALIVSHACGDPQTDAAERKALSRLLPSRPMVAPAAALGHTGAACGAVELVTGVLALARQTIPPTVRVDTSSTTVGFRDVAEPLQGEHVLCISHTAEGSAMAIVQRASN